MSTISVEGKNFWVALLLNCICGIAGLGHLYLGQKSKGITFLVVSLITWLFGLGGIVVLISFVDIWLLKDKIEAGGEMSMYDNGLSFLDGMPGFKEG